MNWGKGLALALIAFAGMMAFFLVRGAQSPEPLITADYYEQELRYQDRIDATQRAMAFSTPIRFSVAREGVRVVLPVELHGTGLVGVLELLRLNDPGADRTVKVNGSAGAELHAAVDLVPGAYIARFSFTADGAAYYHEERVLVP